MFSLPNDNKNNELKYECVILCKTNEEYIKEISKYSSSYDENLEKLKYAGTLTSKTIKNEVNKNSIAYKISNSKIKIKYENRIYNCIIRINYFHWNWNNNCLPH